VEDVQQAPPQAVEQVLPQDVEHGPVQHAPW
jgi:hypothetical protein